MIARHVMLAWYMCSFEIFYGICTSIAKKTIFLWFSRGGGSRPPAPLWICPWLDCFHQQTELCPYWVTLSVGIRDIAWRQILKWNKQLMISLEIADTSQGDRTIIVPSPWGYRRMTDRCPYDFMGHAKASCGNLAGSLRLSQESTIIFGPRWQSKTLRCPHDHRAVPIRGSYDVTVMCLRAYDFFKFVIVRS